MTTIGATVAALAVAAGCGGRTGSSAGPVGNRAAPVVSRPLVVEVVDRDPEMECKKHDLAIRQVDGGAVVAEELIEGECHGACTPEDKAAGQQALDEAQAAVDGGETESLLDYNFTDCYFTGAEPGRIVQVDGAWVALIAGEHPGPHDVPNRYFRLATISCGALFVSEELGATYANSWSEHDLTIHPVADGLRVVGQMAPSLPAHELYRVTFDPACKAPPAEDVRDASIPPGG